MPRTAFQPDDYVDRYHVGSNAWTQRCDREDETARRFLEWRGGRGTGHVYDCDDVAAVNDFRRTFSMPTFVQPLGDSVSQDRPVTGGSLLPRLTTGRSRCSELPSRMGTSTSRLRKKHSAIEAAVQKEFAKSVAPLKERLRAERSARRELEAELMRFRSAGGGEALTA
mmetsp:Transcript_63217/g.181808  ORF Transcript_63217/g.181808 Transcript_63217/m.181808 type:complete len:168 (-) Transcript_63217:60-563(-)|eukprot:CAMPEP_0176014308 /NCGR_PEP_ID=MMETSP0120_2-20121206/6756_1 /TAXON_ID=160619 /ORGANISM="Kryptoperidinium foliaceum, Strain CCMP 1326" /LENGTH=167 /DNA_ID=CAMNT_0017347245 /DNA_START=49 /DNA_END=552 /DNA_ORIENTATION=-